MMILNFANAALAAVAHARSGMLRRVWVRLPSVLLAAACGLVHGLSAGTPQPPGDAPPSAGWGSDEDALSVLRQRLERALFRPIDDAVVSRRLDTITAAGNWEEISYAVQEGFATVQTKRHLYWVEELAIAYRDPESPWHGDPRLGEAVKTALRFWLEADYSFRNWWENVIGVPLRVGRIALLLEDELDPAMAEAVSRIMQRASREMTGQNLIWIEEVRLLRGILEHEVGLVETSLAHIAAEIRITTEEGIQADFSFHQHGSELYNHGYGAGFLNDCVRLFSCAEETRFALSRDRLVVLSSLLLDGSRWMTRGSFLDFGAMGRSNTRRGASPRYLLESSEALLRFETGREAALKDLQRALADPASDTLAGNRVFYRSDFMVHRRPSFYGSVRLCSERTVGVETMNGEGLKNYYLSDGCTLLLRDGGEYADIQPVWDWRRIPGVTGIESDDPIPSTRFQSVELMGTASFAGGVSDGGIGCVGFDYDRDGVTARKGSFGFDWGMVFLGAGITCTSSERLHTSVNQTWYRAPVLFAGPDGQTVQPHLGDAPEQVPGRWVHHDQSLYLFPSDQELSLSIATQEGSWHEINRGESSEPVSGDVFSLTLDHGIRPQEASYSYAWLPGTTLGEATGLAENPPFRILANRPAVQAVEDRATGQIEVIFYAPTEIDLPADRSLLVDRPCALLLQENSSGITLVVASPEHATGPLNVRLTHGPDAPATEFLVELPSDRGQRGASLTVHSPPPETGKQP